jgi:MSHA biogenesis protein MshL
MKNTCTILAAFITALALAGCAHESKITQSSGHIDGQQTTSSKAADIPKPVVNTVYLPPPKSKAKEQTYSVVVNEVPVKEVLFALARESKLNIDIHPSIQGRVTLNAVDQTLSAILERLSKQVDLRYKIEGNVLSIVPDFPTFRTYKVNYVNMDRDTEGSIGVATEIASTGAAATTDSSSSSSSSSSGSSSSGNSSKTTVNSKSQNKFWDSLADNVRIILKTTKTQAANAEEQVARAEAARSAQEDRLKQVEAVSKAGAGAEKLFQEAFKAQPANVESKDEVIVNPSSGTLTVMGTERQQGFIQQYLDTVMASVLRQVLIEATIVEVTLNDTYQFGIDWALVAGNFSFAQLLTGSPLKGTLDGSRNGLASNNFVAGYSSDNLKAAMKALETFGNTRVLSSPKMMALNNQTAILKVVDNLVYFTIVETAVAGNTTTNNSVATTSTPHTVPVGVVMSVTPQIADNGQVTLIVRPTISRQSGEVEDPANKGSFIPEIQVREMESVLEVGSGHTVVLGGLMQDTVQKDTQGVPVLSKLPYIGKIFESNNDKTTKSELVIFLRPTVITHASLESDELRSFKQYLPAQQPQQAVDEPVN